jgi:hypothetical protein
MARLIFPACAAAVVLGVALAAPVPGVAGSPEEIQRQEQAVRAAEGDRQRAQDRHILTQRAFEKARLNATQAATRIAEELSRVSKEEAAAKVLPDSPDKTARLKAINEKEARLREELVKSREPAQTAQRERAAARAELNKAIAAETEAKATLARLKGEAPPATPPKAAASGAAPKAAVAKTAAPAATLAEQEKRAAIARAEREKAEHAWRAAAAARVETETRVAKETQSLQSQLVHIADVRKKIESVSDPAKKTQLTQQATALETKVKAELATATAPVAEARQKEAVAKTNYDKAAAAEQQALKTLATMKGGR